MRVIRIGRSSQNDFPINDPYVGRFHCQIMQHDNGQYTLSDLRSANGTYVNGIRVSGQTVLNPNDVVRIGNTTLPWRLYFEEAEGEGQPSPHVDIPYQSGGNEPGPSNPAATANKERHGFVTFWLWLMIISNIIGAIMQAMSANYAIWAYATYDNAQLFFYVEHGVVDYYICAAWIMVVLSLVNVAGAIMLLKWKKMGYWFIVGSAVACLAIMISFGVLGGFSASVVYSIVGAVIGPIALWAILQISKNGLRCWYLLK